MDINQDSSWENDFSFWKNLLLAIVFFTITPITLGISIFSLLSLSKLHNDQVSQTSFFSKSGVKIYASLPSDTPTISADVIEADARPEIIKNYLVKYNSPLIPYASYLVSEADKYNLDYRLVTAIAQQESNLCKVIPEKTYNCWGWGIHSKGTLGFNSFEEGIEIVSRGLRNDYFDKGYATVDDIMSKYTPQSNGSWAFGVKQFLAEME